MELRRISDGVKVTQRYRTTEQVERAYVDEATYNYLYKDGDDYIFMNPKSFEQITVPADILGDSAAYLSENMEVSLQTFKRRADRDRAAGQGDPRRSSRPSRRSRARRRSSSFKPAKLSNGVRTMVPHQITPGAMIVVSTEDGAYVERAKG